MSEREAVPAVPAEEPKTMKVKVVQGFQHKRPEGASEDEPLPIHLPGAVIELPTEEARIEIDRNRVVKAKDDEELREGDQPDVAAKKKAAEEQV